MIVDNYFFNSPISLLEIKKKTNISLAIQLVNYLYSKI